ncbi:hypothetical protein KUCAC02_005877 [Chaenocephalus aceratus]|uniref:Uncharacterized protein n=1 Tax=Chaenocephalus aceratus TaxID=36190 RepID=A0ACB9WQR3_CHAAC|nr:hypothetical protein KUCAC02_005877 [Chaenocephalus aceratus]
MLIEGLSKLPSEDAKQLAFDLAQRWIKTNCLAYMKYEAMFEKLLDQYGATLTSGGSRVLSGLLLPLVISATVMLQ